MKIKRRQPHLVLWSYKIFLVLFISIFAINSSQFVHAGGQWPPQLGQPYPDLTLVDQEGNAVNISDFKGKVLFIEYVGMTCPACQAFSGANKSSIGSFKNVHPQGGLQSIEEYFPSYAGGLTLDDDRIAFIQIILYSMSMGAPTAQDAKEWAAHFKMDRSKGKIVLAGKKELLGDASYNLIPGFQLVDKNFILRSDSTGHNPRHSLYTHLIPMTPKLLRE